MRNFLTLILLASLVLLPTLLSAQLSTKRIVIINGGQFGNPSEQANLISYNPDNQSFTVIDTIHNNSAQDILVETHYAYVAAQDSIVKYDLVTEKRVAAAAFGGLSTVKLAIYDDVLVVGNWYGLGSGNLRMFDKMTLAFLDSIPEVSKGAKDFVIVGDSAYITQNFNTASFTDSAGYLSVVDLKNRIHVRDIMLNNNDTDLGRLVVKDNKIYGLNSTSNTVTTYDMRTNSSSSSAAGVDLQLRGNGQQFALLGDTLITKFNGRIGSFLLSTWQMIDSSVIDTSCTAFVIDEVNRQVYLTATDFFSYNLGSIWDLNGNRLASLPVGFAPEALGVVYNHAPVAAIDLPGVYAVGNPLAISVLTNDADADGDSLQILSVMQPSSGSVSISGKQILYSHTQSVNESFGYTMMDVWGDSSSTVVFIGNPMAIGDFENELSIKIGPNPASDFLKIDFEERIVEGVEISIHSIDGSIILNKKLNNLKSTVISINSFSNGIYLLEINSGKKSATRKIVIR